MDCRSKPPDERRRQTIEAVATFSALMHADERGEVLKAEAAQRDLDRLGVVVRFACPLCATAAKAVSRGK